ncbi:MAG: hypothetical protein ACO4AU_09410 [bacterium]
MWKPWILKGVGGLVVAVGLNLLLLRLFNEDSPYRAEHSLVGLLLLLAWAALLHRNSRSAFLLFVLSSLVPCYLGTVVPDWDITLLGIGAHRNPIFHSCFPYALMAMMIVCLKWHWAQVPVYGFGIGLASHLGWDVVFFGDVRWIPQGYDRWWLMLNALICLIPPGIRRLNLSQ